MSNTNADGYFKEDLKVEVGSFSLDMLDMGDEEETVEIAEDSENTEDPIIEAVKNKRKSDEDSEE